MIKREGRRRRRPSFYRSAAPSDPIRGRELTLGMVGRSFLPDPRPGTHARDGRPLLLTRSAAGSRRPLRILAHLSAFSLIFTRRFSVSLTKNAISVFLCNFMLIFQPAARMQDVNYGRFPHFEPLFRPQGTFGAPLPHLKGAADTLPRRFGEL